MFPLPVGEAATREANRATIATVVFIVGDGRCGILYEWKVCSEICDEMDVCVSVCV